MARRLLRRERFAKLIKHVHPLDYVFSSEAPATAAFNFESPLFTTSPLRANPRRDGNNAIFLLGKRISYCYDYHRVRERGAYGHSPCTADGCYAAEETTHAADERRDKPRTTGTGPFVTRADDRRSRGRDRIGSDRTARTQFFFYVFVRSRFRRVRPAAEGPARK